MVKVKQAQCSYSMRKMLPLENMVGERGGACPKYSTYNQTVRCGAAGQVVHAVTKKWSSRVQQEHRNKSQDCVTARLDYSSDNRLEDLESELRNRAWC